MNLPQLSSLDVKEKQVLVRMDFDVPEGDYSRIEAAKETLDYLLGQNAKVILLGHKGRPAGKDESLSLRSLVEPLEKIAGKTVHFIETLDVSTIKSTIEQSNNETIFLLENLRFDPREEANDEGFAQELASLGDIYVNEAFAVSHRAHASIVGIPKFLPHAAGMRFEKEIEMLTKVTTMPERPLVILISGVKDDKLKMVEHMSQLADKVLVGGRLPEYIDKLEAETGTFPYSEKVLVAHLNPDKEDITINSIEQFEREIGKAKSIVLAGVVGKVEDEGHQQGTKRVFEAVANAQAYKVAGGGDTEAALTKFGLTDKFTWISVGGGAMLEYLAKGTLPGIVALENES